MEVIHHGYMMDPWYEDHEPARRYKWDLYTSIKLKDDGPGYWCPECREDGRYTWVFDAPLGFRVGCPDHCQPYKAAMRMTDISERRKTLREVFEQFQNEGT